MLFIYYTEDTAPEIPTTSYIMLTIDAEKMKSAPIATDEFMDAQGGDSTYQVYTTKVGMPNTDFNYDHMGFLIRVFKLDGALQQVVQMSLRPKVLYVSHYTQVSGHLR